MGQRPGGRLATTSAIRRVAIYRDEFSFGVVRAGLRVECGLRCVCLCESARARASVLLYDWCTVQTCAVPMHAVTYRNGCGMEKWEYGEVV